MALVPLAALVWWLLGFLPWVLGGLHDEVQPSDPALEAGVGEHVLALPLTTMHLPDLALGGLVGGVLAGLLGVLAARRRRAALLTVSGAALALVLTLVLTRQQLAGAGDQLFAQEPRVVGSLAAVLAAATLLGWVLGSLGASGGLARSLTLGVLAGALTPHFSAALHYTGWSVTVLDRVPNAPFWLGAALLAVALATVGLTPLTRLLWWPVVLLGAYVVWPVLRGLAHLAPQLRPGSSLADTLPGLIGEAFRSARHALLPSERLMLPWGLAVGVGLMAAIVVELIRDSRLD